MFRNVIKSGTAWALERTNGHHWIATLTGSAKAPAVIGYHRVVERYTPDGWNAIPAMCISRQMLERHLDWIGRRFRFISLEELGARMQWGGRFDAPVAVVTFDDGYRDVYENAFPLLKKKGIPAAMFVCPGLVGTRRLLPHDELYLLLARAFARWKAEGRTLPRFLLNHGVWLPGLDRMPRVVSDPFPAMQFLLNGLPQSELYRVIRALQREVELEEEALEPLRLMDWDMVLEMHRAGMTIGSHTHTHALLPNESRQRMEEETAGSRVELERHLGAPVRHFAYPCGRFDKAAIDAIADAGYRYAFTTCLHHDQNYPLLTISRKLLWENSCLDSRGVFSAPILSCQLKWVYDLVVRCQQNHGCPPAGAMVYRDIPSLSAFAGRDRTRLAA
jgi:peptidoglycan/xylan/chitin deacetylase (PgdA/CDA1 family)